MAETPKFEILYPRHPAQIHEADSADESILSARIAEIEINDLFREHRRLLDLLRVAQRTRPRFTCWHCSTETPLKDLVLHDFVHPSDESNHDRTDDYNIICPNCGRFSYLDRSGYADRAQFKATEEHEA